MKSIALVIPYFGKFKDYYKFWLQSCANNPTVDFFIFTDDLQFISNVNKSEMGGTCNTYHIG